MTDCVSGGNWTLPGPAADVRGLSRAARRRGRGVTERVDDEVAVGRVGGQHDLEDPAGGGRHRRRLGRPEGLRARPGAGGRRVRARPRRAAACRRRPAGTAGAAAVGCGGRLTWVAAMPQPAEVRTTSSRDATRGSHRRGRRAAHQPGGQVNGRPPMRWKWRWSTVWPPHAPTFVTIRYPPSAIPSARAIEAATARRRPVRSASLVRRGAAAEAMWRARDDQDVGRRSRRDVAERDDQVVGVDLGRRDLAGGDARRRGSRSASADVPWLTTARASCS